MIYENLHLLMPTTGKRILLASYQDVEQDEVKPLIKAWKKRISKETGVPGKDIMIYEALDLMGLDYKEYKGKKHE
jgi:hypothetical protein